MRPEISKTNCLGLTVFLLLVTTTPSAAQEQVAKLEVFGGYAFIRADSSEGRVNLNGWTASPETHLNRTIALAADFDGAYGRVLGERISVHSAMLGPKFTARNKRLKPFAHALFGVVREAEAGDVQYGFGMTFGGGVDYDLNRRMSFRLAQTDYEYTRVNLLTHHNYRFAAGVVLKFGELK